MSLIAQIIRQQPEHFLMCDLIYKKHLLNRFTFVKGQRYMGIYYIIERPSISQIIDLGPL